MANYSRPATGFRYLYRGVKTNAAPDSLAEDKYPVGQNIRAYSDHSVRTRPGQVQLFTSTDGVTTTDIRAYAALNTDNTPRFLARGANDKVWLDTGAQAGTLLGAGASPGATMIPFRPGESSTPYMYIANGSDYQKFSAPPSPVQRNVGIVEPQSPVDASLSAEYISYVGLPAGGSYTAGGTAATSTVTNRINDTIQGVFADPLGLETTLQVSGGAGGGLATAIYLSGNVNAYFYTSITGSNGGFGHFFPTLTENALATASGNSLLFNPPQWNGTTDPNQQPMKWATIDSNGNITGYTTPANIPGGPGNQGYDMALIFNVFVPQAGNYTINIWHDDGVFFAIAGASYVSGPRLDNYNHTRTAIGGYSFSNGGIAGNNNSGNHNNEVYVVNFPTAGVYQAEMDYSQWFNEQQLNVYTNGAVIKGAPAPQSYQRGMVINTAGTGLVKVQDVFPAIGQSIAIQGIYYYSGTTGKCVVVPATLSPGPGTGGTSLYDEVSLGGLRRGSLVRIGTEVVYVLNVTVGPSGTICFETTTTGAHTTADLLSGIFAIQVLGSANSSGTAFTAGQVIASNAVTFSLTAGVGTQTAPVTFNPFVTAGNFSFQEEDYVHLSVQVDSLSAINEIKLLLDVGDGSFQQNFYFFTIRPSDIAAAVQNTLTQLGAAQLMAQRAAIDEERAAITDKEALAQQARDAAKAGKGAFGDLYTALTGKAGIFAAKDQGVTFSSAQTSPGNNQWSEIVFSISELTRVGNDESRTLFNVGSMQVLVNASGTANIGFNSLTISGGYGPDIGFGGAPYQYRIRPRSKATGIVGNPCPNMRYGINPRRHQATVFVPTTYTDPQVDTWDVFRYGGSVASWRMIGQVPLGTASFLDTYGDDSALAGEELELDNYEPWPTLDAPFNIAVGNVVSVTGTTAVITVSPAGNVLRFLPGNLVRIGTSQVFTLWTRPTLVSGNNYLFQFLENAGAVAGAISIYEPALARQRLPYMWGPDASGTVFAVGDSQRPGNVYFSKNYVPDAAPDKYNIEVTPPSEILIGGETMAGLSFVSSTERWWAMYPSPENPLQRFNLIQQPVPRGLAAPWGHCTDGVAIYFWAKDGIWSSQEGSLTDADLYNIFPHEGVSGQQVTYNNYTYFPPDYSRAGTFRLAHSNGYLYATYQDSAGVYRCLVLDLKRKAWYSDVYNPAVSVVYHVEQQEGTLLSNTTLYAMTLFGTVTGKVAKQVDLTNDLGGTIPCAVATREWTAEDLRASEQWGDLVLDALPAAQITATPMQAGAQSSPPTTITASQTRALSVVSVGGVSLQRFLGLLTTWTEDFTLTTVPTTLYLWQPSLIPKPETITDRITDWDNAGTEAAKWVQGFVLHADTFGVGKGLACRDADTLTTHAFAPAVNHNGESVIAYSFNTPFIAHMMRLEPTDAIKWRFFGVEFVYEPTPEAAETWQTQGTSFGLNGYSHVQRILAAYSATAAVTLTVTSFDGQSPQPITLPSTGGAYQKAMFTLTPNKGQLYFFSATSAQPWQAYLDDWEIWAGNWGRSGAYLTFKGLGGIKGDKAKI